MAIKDLSNVVRPKGFYRPDIDGMRALAVLAVVAYHYSPSNLPGGFIGVDVFFVISGYLITGILVTEIREKEFPTYGRLLLDFYQRRIRRIFPSLILVLGAYLIGKSNGFLTQVMTCARVFSVLDETFQCQACTDG